MMTDPQDSKSVVVGIDGSQASINAAKWAIPEALSRDMSLRLLYVISAQLASEEAFRMELEHGTEALFEAEDTVRRGNKAVKVDTVVLRGDVDEILIDESRHAAMVCMGVGRKGGRPARPLGPTVAALAKRAHCTVAIIRTDDDMPSSEAGVIAVVLDDQPDNDEVVHHAMREGRLRRATVRQIDRRLDSWVRRYPDVHVETVAAGTGSQYRENDSPAVQLAVVGRADADEVAQLVTPNCHPITGYPDCSILVVRN